MLLQEIYDQKKKSLADAKETTSKTTEILPGGGCHTLEHKNQLKNSIALHTPRLLVAAFLGHYSFRLHAKIPTPASISGSSHQPSMTGTGVPPPPIPPPDEATVIENAGSVVVRLPSLTLIWMLL